MTTHLIAASCSAKIAKAPTAQTMPIRTPLAGAAGWLRLSGVGPTGMRIGLHWKVRSEHFRPEARAGTNAAPATGLRPARIDESRGLPITYSQSPRRHPGGARVRKLPKILLNSRTKELAGCVRNAQI